MKKYKIILFAIVGALLLHGCYDEKMEWGTPEDHNPIKSSEIPLNLAEKIANYDFIKTYVPAGMIVGIGAGADLYISDPAYKKVVDDNFQMITTGNAMKHSSVVRNNGSLDFHHRCFHGCNPCRYEGAGSHVALAYPATAGIPSR